ncbi:MAG: FAD binding domain-containing protein [Mycobacterium sp.]|nr:FAD binding domain-containing protein [Mycobacterium sp.]
MKPAEFDYVRPQTVAEALGLLAENPEAKVLAGGQSLLTLMNLRLARPAMLIDIGALDELRRIFDDTDELVLGSLITHRTVETDPLIGARAPLLADAARHIGHIGIRNRGTIGGSVAHADPAAEMPLATLVLDATFHIESAATGRREVSAEDMFVSFYTNALEQHELLTWVSIPNTRPDQGWGFVEYAHQHGDYGMAGAGCALTLSADGRVSGIARRCARRRRPAAAVRRRRGRRVGAVGDAVGRARRRLGGTHRTRGRRRRLCAPAVRIGVAGGHDHRAPTPHRPGRGGPPRCQLILGTPVPFRCRSRSTVAFSAAPFPPA